MSGTLDKMYERFKEKVQDVQQILRIPKFVLRINRVIELYLSNSSARRLSCGTPSS